MANPYSFMNTGAAVAASNPWSKRATKPTEAAAPAATQSWQNLGSYAPPSNAASFPTTPQTNTAAVPAYNPGAPVNWTNFNWYGGTGTGTGGAPNTAPAGNIPVPTGTVTPVGAPATNYAGFGTMPAWLSGDWATPTNPTVIATNKDNRAAYAAYIAAMVPYLQTQQNAAQYGQDFNEAQRRYNLDKAWQMASDQYTQGLAGRAQNMSEWQAQETARQWAQTQGYQQQRDAAEMALAQYQTNQTVWGRTQAPNVRWMRSW